MAGRLRKQLKVINELGWAVRELADRIQDAAPPGVLHSEVTLKRIRGEEIDEKAELWNDLSDAAERCANVSADLSEFLEARIAELPTYRPPAMLESSAEQPAKPAKEPPQVDSLTTNQGAPETSAEG